MIVLRLKWKLGELQRRSEMTIDESSNVVARIDLLIIVSLVRKVLCHTFGTEVEKRIVKYVVNQFLQTGSVGNNEPILQVSNF